MVQNHNLPKILPWILKNNDNLFQKRLCLIHLRIQLLVLQNSNLPKILPWILKNNNNLFQNRLQKCNYSDLKPKSLIKKSNMISLLLSPPQLKQMEPMIPMIKCFINIMKWQKKSKLLRYLLKQNIWEKLLMQFRIKKEELKDESKKAKILLKRI